MEGGPEGGGGEGGVLGLVGGDFVPGGFVVRLAEEGGLRGRC